MKNNLELIITHKIAEVVFRTESDVNIPHVLLSPFSKFQIDNIEPTDVFFRIHELDLNSSIHLPFSDSERDRICRSIGFQKHWVDRPILQLPDVREKINNCMDYPELAYIDLKWGRVVIRNYATNELDVFYPPERKSEFDDLIILAPYRNLLATFLLNFSSLMLHSAGIIRNETAMLFVAPDEGGKSSLIHLANGAVILSDDQVVLNKQQGIVKAHGTPFAPLSSGPQQAKLGGIFLLEKSSRFALTRISAKDALQFLWNEHTHQWFILPRELRVRAFELMADACKQAQIYRLQFQKNFMDWDAIDDAIGKNDHELPA